MGLEISQIISSRESHSLKKPNSRSQAVLFTSLCTNEATIKETNKLFYSLFWNGKNYKIKLDIMINNYPDGGLKMVDIESFNKALKVTWVKKCLDKNNRGKWNFFLFASWKTLLRYFTANLNKIKFNQHLKHKRQHLKEILLILSEINP